MKENTVLFVDDELNVLSALKRGMMGEPYQCIFASSGPEALELMSQNEISVIITDMRMPGMDGLKLLKAIKEKHPLTLRIVLSGYTQLPQVLTAINQAEIFKFITKPWSMEDELKPLVRQAVEFYNYLKQKEMQKNQLEKRNEVYQKILKTTDEKLGYFRKEIEALSEVFNKTIDAVHKSCKLYPAAADVFALFSKELINQYLEGLLLPAVEIKAQKLFEAIKYYMLEQSIVFEETEAAEAITYEGEGSIAVTSIKLLLKLLEIIYQKEKIIVRLNPTNHTIELIVEDKSSLKGRMVWKNIIEDIIVLLNKIYIGKGESNVFASDYETMTVTIHFTEKEDILTKDGQNIV